MRATARRRRLRELLERALANMNVSEEEWVRAVRDARREIMRHIVISPGGGGIATGL